MKKYLIILSLAAMSVIAQQTVTTVTTFKTVVDSNTATAFFESQTLVATNQLPAGIEPTRITAIRNQDGSYTVTGQFMASITNAP